MGFSQLSAQTQDDLFIVFGSVKMEDTNKRTAGVKVLVLQDGVQYDELYTDAKGDYDFELPLRHDYTFSFELEGHSNKRIEVDASGIPETTSGNRNMDLDMSLFLLPAGFDNTIFDSPYGRGDYDYDKNTVVFDNNVTLRMRNKVQAEFGRLERLEGELERMQEDFEAFVKKGDQSASRAEWQQAVDFYDSALALFPDDENAISKRGNVQLKLDESLASNEAAAAFSAKLDEGREALSEDRLEAAVVAFQEAASMQPDSPEPAVGLRDVETRREALKDQGEYDQIIVEADNLFDREQYEKAIKVYDDAIRLKPSERYPTDRKMEAQTRLDDLASESASIVERTMAYEVLIGEANKLFRDDDYASALQKYEEASLLLPAERLPKQRAEECRERIAEAEAEEEERKRKKEEQEQREADSANLREMRLQYDAINDEADVLFRNDDYAAAIVKYGEALAVLPDERYPMQRMTEAQKRLDEAAEESSADDLARASDAEEDQKALEDQRAQEAAEREAAEREAAEREAAEKEAAREAERAAADSADAEKRQARDDLRAEQEVQDEAERKSDQEEAERNALEERQAREDLRAEMAAQDEADRNERELRNEEAIAASNQAALLDAEFEGLISDGDDAFSRSDWGSANAAYTSALGLKPNDRYANKRLTRIAEKQNALNLSMDEAKEEARRAAIQADALELQREEERADALAKQSQEEELKRRQQAELTRQEQANKERKSREDQARNRAQELASAMNNPESDEVELYYREALKSEERSRQLDVENRKLRVAELSRESALAAKARVEEELLALSDLEQENITNTQAALKAQRVREESLNARVDDYDRAAVQSARKGRENINEGVEKAEMKKNSVSRLRRNRSQDYTSSVPELEQKKRGWRNLFRDSNRASADRRSINSENARGRARKYRQIGNGADLRAQERHLAIRRKEKETNRRMSKRKLEADQRAFDSRIEELERSKNASDDTDSYVLSEADQEVLMGIHEESYDIPNGLVIERTVRTGNLVVRYRKVVTKTGIYYFRGDRSITLDTWKRETRIVLD